jgi:hypothetical protein
MRMIEFLLMVLTVFGTVQAAAGLLAVRAFAARRSHHALARPPVTILKPVCGDEPLLEEAINSSSARRTRTIPRSTRPAASNPASRRATLRSSPTPHVMAATGKLLIL